MLVYDIITLQVGSWILILQNRSIQTDNTDGLDPKQCLSLIDSIEVLGSPLKASSSSMMALQNHSPPMPMPMPLQFLES